MADIQPARDDEFTEVQRGVIRREAAHLLKDRALWAIGVMVFSTVAGISWFVTHYSLPDVLELLQNSRRVLDSLPPPP
ncbi:MAG TPA: hypothetical protein ENK83_02415 [Aliiroseovarius sp.]|nr:hypothetical protein [Aliiroseovarius sp.]